MTPNDFQISSRETVEKLLESLQGLPQVQAEMPNWQPVHYGKEIDVEIDFMVGDKRFVLLIEVKKAVYPRDVREVLWQIGKFTESTHNRDRNRTIVPLLAAESISLGAKLALMRANVGYFDTGGSLFIPARGAYFYIEKPPPKTLEKSVRALFKGKSSQVFQALFHRRDYWFGVKELAQLAKVSPATASETLTALERFDWVVTRGQGPSKVRRLSAPSALLDEWKRQVAVPIQPDLRLRRRADVPLGQIRPLELSF
jgi:hypothetical protein